jgi:hypothetical protein
VSLLPLQMEAMLNGMINQPAETFDVNIVDDLTNELFGNVGLASDLMARNIQRAREHGIPGYNEFRDDGTKQKKLILRTSTILKIDKRNENDNTYCEEHIVSELIESLDFCIRGTKIPI